MLPALPVVFGKSIFDAGNREFIQPGLQPIDHLLTAKQLLSLAPQPILSILVKVRGSDIEGNFDLVTCFQPCLFDRPDDQLDCHPIVFQLGSIAALVTNQSPVISGLGQQAPQLAVDSHGPFQRGWIIRRPAGHHQHILDIDIPPCMQPT